MSCWVGDNDTSSISAVDALSANFEELLKTGGDISDVTFLVEKEVMTPFFIGRTHFCTTNLGIW
mgnify:CR=1 FL=1